MKKIPIILLLLFPFWGCSGGSGSAESDKPTVQNTELKPSIFKLNGKELLNPRSISIADSVLIVVESAVPNNFISMFSINDGNLLFEDGVRGRGPGEFSEIIQHTVSMKGDQNSNPSIFDWVSKNIHELDVHSTIVNNAFEFRNRHILTPEFMLVQRASILNDSTAIAAGGMYQAEFATIDFKNDGVNFIAYNQIEHHPDHRSLIDLRRGEIAVNFRNESIVHASKWFPNFAIYDFNLEQKHIVKLKDYDVDHILALPENERVLYIKDIKTTDDSIWVLYIGKTYEEMEEYKEDEAYNRSSHISKVFRYNFSGELLETFTLLDGYYQFMEFDEINNRLFTIDIMKDDDNIVYFQL
ncbi:MAG: hypothetical protein LAT67_15820 [Balneolales bacterium]|nr:hypothetical protein [Balneolales bacterium]